MTVTVITEYHFHTLVNSNSYQGGEEKGGSVKVRRHPSQGRLLLCYAGVHSAQQRIP